jgi:hypothetical protein
MARKEKTTHYIYKTTCNITGRYYIGMHSTSNLEDGYMGSGKRLRRSIRKYGVENHTKEILEYLKTRQDLILRETEVVTKELISDDKCMNLKEGGQGGWINEEHQKKAQISSRVSYKKRFDEDEEFRVKTLIILKNNLRQAYLDGKYHGRTNFKDKHHSDETKKFMSEQRKGTGVSETNSQFGTCWITKDSVNKKIKREEIETYLKEGWVKGRK